MPTKKTHKKVKTRTPYKVVVGYEAEFKGNFSKEIDTITTKFFKNLQNFMEHGESTDS